MAKIEWDEVGKRYYENGVKRGVLFIQNVDGTYRSGIAWNGLTAVNVSPEGGEAISLYADDIKYLTLRSAENFKGTIEAFSAPDEFAPCDGCAVPLDGVLIGQQPRKSFAFSYVTTFGNDVQRDEFGYKIHIIWGATVGPAEKSYQSINDSPEAITFSWEMDTVPVVVPGYKVTSHMEIDSTLCNPDALDQFEDILYGTDNTDPTLMLPAEIKELFEHPTPVMLIDEFDNVLVFGDTRIIVPTCETKR